MIRAWIQKWAALLAIFVWSIDALACPLCHSGTGKEVRAGIFGGGDFLFNLFVVVAPFPILALVVAWIYYGPPRFLDGLIKNKKTSPSYGDKYGNVS